MKIVEVWREKFFKLNNRIDEISNVVPTTHIWVENTSNIKVYRPKSNIIKARKKR
ncbi:MAG: hypothetical protein PHV68_05610 [Candidatus Gastranaerophilales bacterium]|nr:hypothetical protein [Candidatus Gastranaerophilales bacterium]